VDRVSVKSSHRRASGDFTTSNFCSNDFHTFRSINCGFSRCLARKSARYRPHADSICIIFMNKACEHSIANYKTVDGYLDGIASLPPTPQVLIQLIDLFRQSTADVDEIVQLLRRDPALSLEVLRRCNSSFFGNDDTVKDINEAVYRMGFYEVYQITATLFGMRALTAPSVVPGFPAAELRRHSSIAGIAAGALAREVNESEGIAFTTALLHDIGKLIFAIAEQAKYVALIDQCKLTGAYLSNLEVQAFGFSHSELGAQLLRRWGMTEEVVLPVLGHNSPAAADKLPLCVLTRAASELANHFEAKVSETFSATPTGIHLSEVFELKANELDDWEHLVRSKIRQLDLLKPL